MRSGVAAAAMLLATGIAVALPVSGRLSTKIYGQQLVDEVLTRHPEVFDGDDKSALLASSTRIRDALSSQVDSLAALLALDP